MTAPATHLLHYDDILDGESVQFATGLSLPDDGSIRVADLDASHLGDSARLHARLFKDLGFPDHYGHNWDALVDVLSDPTWAEGVEGVVIAVHATDLAAHAQTLDNLAGIVQAANSDNQAYDEDFAVRLVIQFDPPFSE